MNNEDKNIKRLKITLIVLSSVAVAMIIAVIAVNVIRNNKSDCYNNHEASSSRPEENSTKKDSKYYDLPEVHTVGKPVLYIYPEVTSDVSVSYLKPEQLTTTYPLYNNGWHITAHPNGDLYDSDNNYYYALYWESEVAMNHDFESGFYVETKDSATFLEEKLSEIGLSPRERNEFIMYWLPKMEKGDNNLVRFMLTDEVESIEPISITPKPDSMLRMRIIIKKTNTDPKLPRQELPPTFTRKGMTVVDWGGTEINENN